MTPDKKCLLEVSRVCTTTGTGSLPPPDPARAAQELEDEGDRATRAVSPLEQLRGIRAVGPDLAVPGLGCDPRHRHSEGSG